MLSRLHRLGSAGVVMCHGHGGGVTGGASRAALRRYEEASTWWAATSKHQWRPLATRGRGGPQSVSGFDKKAHDHDHDHDHDMSRITNSPMAAGEDAVDEVNALDAKQSRSNILHALRARASDAIRYEYYAQRAELEAETEASSLFRALGETAKQQALGHLEILEEFGGGGDGDGGVEIGATMENLAAAADSEREAADGQLRNAAAAAGDDGLAQVEEWFDDLADAGHRAAARLDAVHAMLEDELVDVDIDDASASALDQEAADFDPVAAPGKPRK